MTRSMSALPGNRSRTSTQAMIVPITMLTAVTTSELPTVSLRALSVCWLVSASLKAPNPSSAAVAMTAESGISTRRLNQIIVDAQPQRGAPGQVVPRGRPAHCAPAGLPRHWWSQ